MSFVVESLSYAIRLWLQKNLNRNLRLCRLGIGKQDQLAIDQYDGFSQIQLGYDNLLHRYNQDLLRLVRTKKHLPTDTNLG